MRVSDYIYACLKSFGIDKVFTLTGGGAMHLNDAAALAEPDVHSVFCHHEQGAAMAAVAHAKFTRRPAACCVTTGCGSTNAITGLLEAWQDNVPVIFISGQVNLNQTTYWKHHGLRNLGVQEANIIDIVKPITKAAHMITNVDEVVNVVNHIFHSAIEGRPGPVWLDIPMDIQAAQMPADIDTTPQYNMKIKYENLHNSERIANRLAAAQRPVILAGNGVNLSGAENFLAKYAKECHIPIVTTYLSADLIKEEDGVHIGTVGIKGNRAANFAMQNSDLLLVIGCRLSVPVTGYDYSMFAREAHVAVVDIDKIEHEKNTVRIDEFIHEDALNFLMYLPSIEPKTKWLEKCIRLKNEWSYLDGIPNFTPDTGMDLYRFINFIKKNASDDTVFITDTGSPYYAFGQAMHFRGKQRYITSSSQACMGFALPAIVGVASATDRQIISIIGDGSFQLNMQELQTISSLRANAKIFVINNGVYLSIRSTQLRYFDRTFGTGDDIDVLAFPSLQNLAEAFNISYYKIVEENDISSIIDNVFKDSSPAIIEVLSSKHQPIIPMLAGQQNADGTITPKPLEDMYPFLDREIFYAEMDIKSI